MVQITLEVENDIESTRSPIVGNFRLLRGVFEKFYDLGRYKAIRARHPTQQGSLVCCYVYHQDADGRVSNVTH